MMVRSCLPLRARAVKKFNVANTSTQLNNKILTATMLPYPVPTRPSHPPTYCQLKYTPGTTIKLTLIIPNGENLDTSSGHRVESWLRRNRHRSNKCIIPPAHRVAPNTWIIVTIINDPPPSSRLAA